ncbi:lumenal Hsp70 protein [Trapelia coarctata]|nr:lumenal Hsp70 protein [Trapelia coarctata]
MPPHGRRRNCHLLLLLSLVTFLVTTASAASAVLGIDIGTEYIKAALVKPGIPLEIVLTKDSKRKEAAAVAFKPLRTKSSSSSSDAFPERLYGGDALALSARYPSDVYLNLKPLLGLKAKNNGFVKEYSAWHPGLKIVETQERGTVSFQSESFVEGEDPFTVEELLAMEFQNIKSNAEAFAGKGSMIRDVVLSIPGFYTAEEKRAIQVAADLADLRVLAMTSDGLSVGLNYATSRTFPVVKGTVKPEYHLVYDMGAGSTTATILRFQGKNVKDVGKFNKTVQDVQVLGVGWDKTLGGDAFNGLILEDLITKFGDSKRIKALGADASFIKKDGRTVAKLWKEVERLRQVLSANTEATSSFEGLLYEDVNFKYKLTRAEFESLTAKYTERVRFPIMQALSLAKLDLVDLESVILHGGAVRTPFVQKELESIIGSHKVRTNVNSDEAACFGAAFKAAGISPSFRVKEIRVGDVAAHAVGLSWVSDGKERQQKLFQQSSHTGTEKQVPFKITEDFSFSLHQQILDGVEGTRDIPISRIQTLNLTASVKELTEKSGCSIAGVNTTFSIRLSPINGLPEVTRGSVSCEAVETKKGDFVDNVKGLFGFGSKKGEQDTLGSESETSSTSSKAATESPAAPPSKSSASEPKASSSKTTEKPKDAKKKIEVVYVGISVNETGLPQFSPSELRRIKDRMASFDASDRNRKLREEALNTLEGYTYKARDLIEDEGFVKASTGQERAKIEEKFKTASDWLYGDGADASREELKSRLKELRDLVDPIQKRKEEALKRPQEVKSLQDSLEQTKGLIEMVRLQAAKASEAAASASASSASSASEAQATPQTTSTVDDGFADLEEEPSTTSTKPATASKVPEMPTYSTEDIADMSRTHESIKKWLDDKLAEQEKLGPTDDPVILSSDLAAKSKELNKVVMEVLQKKMQVPPKPKSSKKPKKSKTKSPKKSKTTSSNSSSTSAAAESDIPKVDKEGDAVNPGEIEEGKDEL